MKRVKTSVLLVSLCSLGMCLLLAACTKDPVYPVEPSISYVSFTKILNNTGHDQKGILKISFTDGDGDIGLTEFDTDPPYDTSSVYFYNFFITYYEKQHGNYVAVTLPISNNSRIPKVPPADKGLPLQGDIDIELYINNPMSTFDTIKFDAYIVDRALHQSNLISTPDIIISK
jgi:hypothetical protein